jgi:Putative DNA-binding domain
MENIGQSIGRFDNRAIVGLSARPRGRRTNAAVTVGHHQTSPIEVLAGRFPVVRRLVGEPSFRVVARRFVLSEPPSLPIPCSYGESFPRFLRAQGDAATIEYVADIPELEAARGRARHAAEAVPLGAKALALLRTNRVDGLRVALHPSVSLVQSRFPIVTIWETNWYDKRGNSRIERWRTEAALVARPFLQVEVRRLPPGAYAFLLALARGQTVATAIRIASAATPEFEAASNLALLMDANVVVGIREVIRDNQRRIAS